MRYHNSLDGLLFSTTGTRVLRTLLQTGRQPLTGREVARRARAPPHRTSEVLGRFQREGVVASLLAGNAYLWTLNERHPLIPALRELFVAEQTASVRQRARLRRALSSSDGVLKAVVFGSAARGEEREGSDLDLLVVAANREALERLRVRLFDLKLELWRKEGTRLSPLLYTAAEFKRKRGRPVIENAEHEGDDLLGGEPL